MPDIIDFVRAVGEDDSLASCLAHHRTLPEEPARLVDEPPGDYGPFCEKLRSEGIGRLYSHQARALEHLDRGENVVLSTPTASGKTLVYNLPVLRRIAEDPDARALYLFPLKALEWDQRGRLERDANALGLGSGPDMVAIYDGDTPQSQRKKLRSRPPRILITTPDMLHAGILPHHATWQTFFRNLRFVVIDELHSYRGIFGSHFAQVMRRLDRVARFHGTRPQLVGASATVANPGELATALTGREFQVVSENGAPRARREVMLFRPDTSPYNLAARLFRMSVAAGLRTIAFTKARVITELMHTWVCDAAPEIAPRISSYRAGFLPQERREIEQRLFDGDLLGVISTSALEMGIDVGGLDVCLLVGYPGSQIATWQRGGRVGRAGAAVIALIAQPDALDQYLVSHPDVFFERHFEHAIADPYNDAVCAAHLPCAAAEVPLRLDEPWLEDVPIRSRVGDLEESGALLRSESGSEWFAARRRPHRDVSLRQIGAAYTIALAPEDALAGASPDDPERGPTQSGGQGPWQSSGQGPTQSAGKALRDRAGDTRRDRMANALREARSWARSVRAGSLPSVTRAPSICIADGSIWFHASTPKSTRSKSVR